MCRVSADVLVTTSCAVVGPPYRSREVKLPTGTSALVTPDSLSVLDGHQRGKSPTHGLPDVIELKRGEKMYLVGE